jgi:nitrate reductase beta subunit
MYQSLKDDKQMLGAMMLFGANIRIVDKFKVEGDEVIGWDAEGTEVARVPFTEPTYVREHYDAKHKVYRHNTT